MKKSILKIRWSDVLKHLSVWLAVCAFAYYMDDKVNEDGRIKSFLKEMISICVGILPVCLMFYGNYYSFGLYKKKRFFFNFLIFILAAILIIGFANGFIYLNAFLFKLEIMNLEINKSKPLGTIVLYIVTFCLSLNYYYIRQSALRQSLIIVLQEEKHKLEQDKITNELENALLKQQELLVQQEKLYYEYSFLRLQINPHFLYNTLNFFYAKALAYDKDLAEGVLALSDIMRYALKSNGLKKDEDKKALLVDEIEHLKNIIKINRLRLKNKMYLNFDIKGEIKDVYILPFVLITIVENLFKHGIVHDAEYPAKIILMVTEEKIDFYTCNKKKGGIKEPSTGIGLENIKKD